MTLVMDHYYACALATLAPAGKEEGNLPMLEAATILLLMLRGNLTRLVSVGVPVECARCGQPEQLHSGQRRAKLVKVSHA